MSLSPAPSLLGLTPRPVARTEDGVTARAVVDPAFEAFPGHYPGFPVFPGVCLVEYADQCVLADLAGRGQRAELAAVDRCRFRDPVLPGDELTFRARYGRGVGALGTAGAPGELRVDVTVETARGRAAELRLRYRPPSDTAPGTPPPEPGPGRTAADRGPGAGPRTPDPGPPEAGRPVERADTAAITRIIPHRYPMLLVDRVTAAVPGSELTAVKAVTVAEPVYRRLPPDAGPDAFRYPRPLLVESWAQAAVLLAVWDTPNPDVTTGKVELAGAVDRVVFHRPVHPGDVLEHHVEVVRAVADTTILAGRTLVDGLPAVEVGHFIVALRPLDSLVPGTTAG
ncbi:MULTISPECIES: 3-hydroxyacyl-ACP dehydratase FabZ family protein [unclassified Streptomyces]|uniref:3-hydroxyacyl-ACP dehydratase FabZ family protein n=1 Tax=unclassified Streptomyces TaxID=2593676 RepID=UPI0036B4350C